MDAWRDGDIFHVEFDLPGVDVDSIDLDVERNVLTVKAERPTRASDAELLAAERPRGVFSRQLILGDNLDTENVSASYDGGVLTCGSPSPSRPSRARSPSAPRTRPGKPSPSEAVIRMAAPALHEAELTKDELVDLVCSDPDFVRAEFDAIVEANWGGDMSPPQPDHDESTRGPEPEPDMPATPRAHGRCGPGGPGRRQGNVLTRPRSPPEPARCRAPTRPDVSS